ncbi:Magnesium and cobalt efflux protein CorC [Fundidesulfovibrio magnetotacticus]|uniref:Magnesium and cobalt efflux protein CorC n=1 Tax=Fundidesulfovibrio magnetotacticus TaxID=2730080 RepID=A0A6V8LPD7_9BACT|nr:hemolysin family protein [Fundidesulfovibrio magnetotacticus]GFK93594.1 Magnesium and cobalt efflux protein CorC [Fundidesulfovibrio magnetotacticus]
MLDLIADIALVLGLILLGGCFAAAELAVLTARPHRLEQMASRGSRGARAALDLGRRPQNFLAALQIGVTLLTILSGALGEASLAGHARSLLAGIPALAPHAEALGFALVVAGVTYVSLIAGELVPKRLAIANPEALAVAVARPMAILLRLAAPFVWVLSASTHLVLRLFPQSDGGHDGVSEDELRLLVRQAAASGVLERDEGAMAERALLLDDRPVAAVMTHRARIVALDLDHPERIQATIRATPFNRFPVMRGGLDNLLGVAEAKDLLCVDYAANPQTVRGLLQHPPHVLETTTVSNLLVQLREAGQAMALVVDEFGAVQGLATLTDVLAAIVGGLAPPSRGEQRIAVRQDGSLLVDGLTPASELFELLGRDVPPGEFQTVAGFVLFRLGRIPAVAEAFEHEGHRFEVVDLDGLRIDRVLVQKLPIPG